MARLSIRIDFDEGRRLGPGKVALLEAVEATGSITSAAKSLGMSYRRAWMLIEQINGLFQQLVIQTAHGGAKGGGAHLTPLGEEVVARYRQIERKLQRAAEGDLQFLERQVGA